MYDVCGEALRGEVSGGLRAGSSPRDDAVDACRLAFEPADGVVDELGVDTGTGQVVMDQRVTGSAIGKRGGPSLGEASVVDDPGTSKSR